MSRDWTRRRTDPDGRDVVFDATSHLHLAQGTRSWLLDHVDVILGAIEIPDLREDDPSRGANASIAETSQCPIDGFGSS